MVIKWQDKFKTPKVGTGLKNEPCANALRGINLRPKPPPMETRRVGAIAIKIYVSICYFERTRNLNGLRDRSAKLSVR